MQSEIEKKLKALCQKLRSQTQVANYAKHYTRFA